MKSRINHSSYVIDFLDVDLSSDEISAILEPEVNLILSDLDFPELSDWEIVFKALYTYTRSVSVFRKTRSYVNEKYKNIVIAIPLKKEVIWGVDLVQYITDEPNTKTSKYSYLIEVDPANFPDRTSYILACMRLAIIKSFELGFTVSGHNIKYVNAESKINNKNS